MTFGCKDIGIRKSEFVAKTQFLTKNYSEVYDSMTHKTLKTKTKTKSSK